MLDNKLQQGFARYLRPLPLILCLSFISVSFVTVAAIVNHMDIPTFIASLSSKKVTVAELQQGKFKPVILIDVRTPEEYAEDRIGESPLVPLTDIQSGFGVKEVQAIAKNSTQLNQPQPTIVLYCHSGPRSNKAYKELEKTGLNLAFLSGGITAWRKAIPAEKDAQILTPITLPVKQAILSSPGKISTPKN